MFLDTKSIICIVITLAAVNFAHGQTITNKGAYDGEEGKLPCHVSGTPPNSNRQIVWWQTQGIPIGQYSSENGFEPSGYPGFENKYNMESLEGDLIVHSVNKTEDHNDVYTCGIILEDGTNFTDTNTVQLVVGYKPHDYNIETNGTSIGSCYEHIGLGNLTCSVRSEPRSSIQWTINNIIHAGVDCHDALNKSLTTCSEIVKPDGNIEYKCQRTLTPNPNCYGEYVCGVDYSLADLNEQLADCVIIIENYDWLYYFYIVLVTVAVVIALIALIAAALVCCGVVSCTVCAGTLGGLAICSCFDCYHKNKAAAVTPEDNYAATSYTFNNSNDPPPSYSVLDEHGSKTISAY